MQKKEKVQHFNKRFTTLLNSFSYTTKSANESLVEHYATTLYPTIVMFVKRPGKVILVENYEEAKKVESDLDSIVRHTLEPELKHITSKRYLLLAKFKEEHSNFRIYLVIDGVNPYEKKRSIYSVWPIFVINNNIPLRLSKKREHIILSMIIQGMYLQICFFNVVTSHLSYFVS